MVRLLLGWLAVLLEQLSGLLGGRYLLDTVGEIPLMINEFEDRILRFARLWWVSQDREAVAVRANDQILREAVV